MKKLLIIIEILMVLMLVVSCNKDPYESAELTYEPVLRIFDRDYADADGLHIQTSEQEAIYDLDPLYNMYFFLERPQLVCYQGMDYSGCSVEALTNYYDDSVDGEYYNIIFDRTLSIATVGDDGEEKITDKVLTYTIFYYLDRSVQEIPTYDEYGYPMYNLDGTPATTQSYLDGYIEITDSNGNVLAHNDDIQILLEDRAVE